MDFKRSRKAVELFAKLYKELDIKEPVLDIGAGDNPIHSKFLRSKGIETLTCDFFEGSDYQGNFLDIDFEGRKFGGIWASHVLEHQPNANQFLTKIKDLTHPNGESLISLTVPPLKHEIVGGHLSLWNIGLLYYNLILAGFDCKNSYHATYAYNQSVVFQSFHIENHQEVINKLVYDNGDIDSLAEYFPVKMNQGKDGRFKDKWIN